MLSNRHDDPKYQPAAPPEPKDFDSNVIVSPDVYRKERIPPGQSRTRKWPVLHASIVPHVPLEKWRFDVGGLVERPLSYSWDEFQKLPRVRVLADFHCVTRWSRLGNLWEGVSVREVLSRAGIQPGAKFVIAGGYDGDWTTNLPLEEFLTDDALFADTHDGEPISADHGGPCRLIVPRLYAWKSAKWVRSIELTASDHSGYWEKLGYHNHGDPWKEERMWL